MQDSINVFVVAPTMLCWGFERLMQETAAGVRVVGCATHIRQAAAELREVQADLVVLDYDEVLQVETLRAARLRLPVLLLAPERERENIGRWTRAGVMAVVPKHGAADLLLLAIRSACSAGGADPRGSGKPDHMAAEQGDERVDSLTVRERQLLVALVSNSATSGKVLASKLCISEHTLRNHLTSVYGKLGVHNRLSLHEYALRHQLGKDPRFLHP